MPKQTYKLLRFDGGINNNSEARDIGDNQFADLQNVAIDEVGAIYTIGDMVNAVAGYSFGGGNSENLVAGRGLFITSTDYYGIAGESSGEKFFFFIQDGVDKIRGLQLGGSSADVFTGFTALGSPTYYAVDGTLRVADSDHVSPDPPRWKGYIPKVLWGEDAGDPQEGHTYNHTADTWVETTSAIEGCFPSVTLSGDHSDDLSTTIIGENLILGEKYYSEYSVVGKAPLFGFGNELCDTGTGPGDLTAAETGMYWGFGIGTHALENDTGFWQPDEMTGYQFYCTTMYDDHTQESLPQLFTMYDGSTLTDGGVEGGEDDYVGATPVTRFRFPKHETFSEVGNMVSVAFDPIIKWNPSEHSDTDTGPKLSNFGAATAQATSGGNPRISGVKVYWGSSEDGYGTLWLLMDWNFKKGVRPIGAAGHSVATGGYVMTDSTRQDAGDATLWYNHVHGNGINIGGSSSTNYKLGFQWEGPPKYFQYDVMNGHPNDDIITVDSFKTAVVANRRVYIGNVQQDGKVNSDRMLKTPVNQFDKFPAINNVDVAVNDGDEIIRLVEYADRILQFKKNTMYIINISGAVEYLEAEHKYKGIDTYAGACRTDYGCAWINANGCYLYDGQSVTDLLDADGIRRISRGYWTDFIGTSGNEAVGFNPKNKHIIVKGNSTSMLVYDMVTKSWTFGTDGIKSGNHSQILNHPDTGMPIIYDDTSGGLYFWQDSDVLDNDKDIVILTREIDFGEPAVRKKVYKVYVTYKCNGILAPAMKYGLDGATPTTSATYDGGKNFRMTSGLWEVAEYEVSAKNCKSIQLKIHGLCDATFTINDITLIYRKKSIR